MRLAILACLLGLRIFTPVGTVYTSQAEIYDETPDGYGVIIETGDVFDILTDDEYEIGFGVTALLFDPGTPEDMTDDMILGVW